MRYPNLFDIRKGFIPILFWAVAASGADNQENARKAREIEDNLIAPCCWSQPVSQHHSEAAEKVRNEVSAMVAAGKSREEILDHFVSQYGERILATPRPKGFNILVYVLPAAALIFGTCLLFFLLKKLRSPLPASGPAPPAVPLKGDRYTSIVEKELKDMEE
jgi:cytochrome c-type biogenesis protein CcmH